MADDTSTFIANARLGSSLRLDQNNETVVSGMTEASFETPSVASDDWSGAERNTSESLPPSRFRGGTARRFRSGFGSGRSVMSSGSRMSRMDRSTRSGISQFDPIAEVDETSSRVDDMSVGQRSLGQMSVSSSIRGGGEDGSNSDLIDLASRPSQQSQQQQATAAPHFPSVESVASNGSTWQRPIAPFGASNSVSGGSNTDENPFSRGVNASGMFTSTDEDNISVTSGLTTGMQSVGSRRLGPAVHPFSSVESVATSGSMWQRPVAPFGASNSVSGREGNSKRNSVNFSEKPCQEGSFDEPGITDDEQANILLNAFDNTRFSTHEPKVFGTKEIDVTQYQEVILEADEITPLPEEYVLDDNGNRYHQKDEQKEVNEDPALKRPELEMLPPYPQEDPYTSPFSQRRKWYSLVTVCAAVSLAVAGLCLSIQTLSSDEIQASYYSMQDNNPIGRYQYQLPGYQFGGGLGGIIGGQEVERQRQLVYGGQYGPLLSSDVPNGRYAPADSSLGSSVRPAAIGGSYTGGRRNNYLGSSNIASHQTRAFEDPFNGHGPPQYNPNYGTNVLPALTATPLTSYTPPPSDHDIAIVLDPNFNGAYMDLSVLPYNPHLEMPVVWNVPLSGGSAIKSVFGNCFRLVQCTERGHDILERERELEMNEGGVHNDSNGRRSLREDENHINSDQKEEQNDVQVSVKGSKINYLRTHQQWQQNAAEEQHAQFDPPLRTEMVYTSTYVNVDCSTSTGIDRGIAHELVTSGMTDVIHSPDVYNVGRLFAPPVERYGRAVTIVRDPIERAVAKYEWMRVIDEDVKRMSLEEFARSDYLEDNILVRSLSGQTDGQPLNNIHLAKAKEVLKRKFVIGLFHRMEDSLIRFETFFNWNIGDQGHTCQSNEVSRAMAKHYNNVDVSTIGGDDSSVMTALREKSGMDMALYEFATFLYDYQGHALFGIPADSR